MLTNCVLYCTSCVTKTPQFTWYPLKSLNLSARQHLINPVRSMSKRNRVQTSSTSKDKSKNLILNFSTVDKSPNVGDFCKKIIDDAVKQHFILKDHLCLAYVNQLINSQSLIRCIWYITEIFYPSVLTKYLFISPGFSYSPFTVCWRQIFNPMSYCFQEQKRIGIIEQEIVQHSNKVRILNTG